MSFYQKNWTKKPKKCFGRSRTGLYTTDTSLQSSDCLPAIRASMKLSHEIQSGSDHQHRHTAGIVGRHRAGSEETHAGRATAAFHRHCRTCAILRSENGR